MKDTIGIIGLGIMGGAFARNLAAAGWKVIGYDIDAARNAEAKAAGVEIAHSAEAVAETAADIITSLPTPRAVLDTAEVIARAKAKGRTVIEASTLSLDDKMAFKAILEKAGHTALDCPMSGTGAQAAVKDLVVYASGDSAGDCAARAGVHGLRAQGLRPRRLRQRQQDEVRRQPPGGDPQRRPAAEAMVLAMKAGLDPHQTVEVIASGAGTSRVFELRAPMMAAQHLSAGHHALDDLEEGPRP